MKKALFSIAVAAFVAGPIVTGCQSSDQKEKEAQAKVDEAKRDLETAKKNQEEEVEKAAEWESFRNEYTAKIRENEIRIDELKADMKKVGKKQDAAYDKKVADLEQKNKNLKTRMGTYEKSQSDWASFKREFTHDMDELGQALKDLTVNNKK